MKSINNFISVILAEHQKAAGFARKFFNLTNEQLNWKPSRSNRDSWSIGECFSHLIFINVPYLKHFENALKKYSSLQNNKEFKHSFIGRLIIKSVKPEAKIRLKTTKAFDPKLSNINKDILNEYLDQHKYIQGLIESSKVLDLNKIKITSPLNRFVKYNLGDSFAIIAFHDQRHIAQAERVMTLEGFPK